ncbi:MAG: OmpA family protein [Desulfobacterales bacterium]|nr:OmpA family protein [Desulfobacterales bacterium]
MKKLFLNSLLALGLIGLLTGCAQKAPSMDFPSFTAKQFTADAYDSKVDNFILLMDASSSMGDEFNGARKFDIARTVAQRMNMTIPELGQTAGLRTFGHHDEVSSEPTELLYGMAPYSTRDAAAAMKQVSQPGGWSPMAMAIDAVAMDLKSLPGSRNAVVFISDGLDMDGTVEKAQALKDAMGSSVCFYPILVGDKAEGRARMEKVAEIGDCGFFSTADEIMTSAGMANFVEKAFLNKKHTAAMAQKDSDKDGVYDQMDKCPGTPMGARVNANGCWALDNVLFDFDKSVIKTQAYPMLDEVAAILKKNPAMSVELQGHTDNIGSAAYNMGLSMRRAQAVAAYLVDKGILRNRMATSGFGFKQPVALNGTEYGRALNRRVEIHPY